MKPRWCPLPTNSTRTEALLALSQQQWVVHVSHTLKTRVPMPPIHPNFSYGNRFLARTGKASRLSEPPRRNSAAPHGPWDFSSGKRTKSSPSCKITTCLALSVTICTFCGMVCGSHIGLIRYPRTHKTRVECAMLDPVVLPWMKSSNYYVSPLP